MNDYYKDRLYKIELTEADKNYSIYELLEKNHIKKDGAIVLEDKNIIEYYYNKDGIIEFNKGVGEIPIKDLNEYGFHIKDNEIEFYIIDGIGGSSGPGIDFIDIYNQIEMYLSMHPILTTVIISGTTLVLTRIKSFFDKISNNFSFKTFKKALYHKKKLKEKDVAKAFSLSNYNETDPNDIAAIEIILEYLGYEYNKNTKEWKLKKPKEDEK